MAHAKVVDCRVVKRLWVGEYLYIRIIFTFVQIVEGVAFLTLIVQNQDFIVRISRAFNDTCNACFKRFNIVACGYDYANEWLG